MRHPEWKTVVTLPLSTWSEPFVTSISDLRSPLPPDTHTHTHASLSSPQVQSPYSASNTIRWRHACHQRVSVMNSGAPNWTRRSFCLFRTVLVGGAPPFSCVCLLSLSPSVSPSLPLFPKLVRSSLAAAPDLCRLLRAATRSCAVRIGPCALTTPSQTPPAPFSHFVLTPARVFPQLDLGRPSRWQEKRGFGA